MSEVDFTGHLAAKQEADLGFESSGTLQLVAVAVGDQVKRGQVLARQDTRIAALELARARADRASAQATARVELAHAQAAATTTAAVNARTVESARQAVRNAKQEYDQAQVVWQHTVRESGDSSVTAAKYALVQTALSSWRSAQAALKQAEKEALQANEAAVAAVDAATVALKNTEQASATTAGVSMLLAAEQLASVRLSKHVLVTPFDGTVTDVMFNPGAVAMGGQAAVTVQSVDDLQIVAPVPETDATSLHLHLPVTVSVDALPEESWQGQIVAIDPAPVLIEGVPTYQVTVALDTKDQRHKPGLSASVNVRLQEKLDVIAIPRRAITTSDGQKQVRVMHGDGVIEERPVTVGLPGSDGNVEITEGLREGETIIVRQP